MSQFSMSSDVWQDLNSILRLQLKAVKQHFIHVLILDAWGDAETAEGITAVDSVDLPNAMRIVDLMVSRYHWPTLSDDQQCLAEHMPNPGSSYEAIFAAERGMEKRLTTALRNGQGSATATGAREVMHLILDPLLARKNYEHWMQNQLAAGRRSTTPSLALSERVLASLNTMFAHLMVVIEQGLVHSFVHWHGGRKGHADAAWEMSGAAMMQATEITKLLAVRRLAPRPADAVRSREVMLPRVGRTSDEAMMRDKMLAERCCAVAEKVLETLSGTDFVQVCRSCEAYYRAARDWQPGHKLPQIKNPCRDFERTLRKYVRGDTGTDLASA